MTCERERAAFTLLEIIVVIFLMGLIASFFLGLPSTTPGSLRNSGRVVAGELEYTAQRAIATGHVHRWVVDLDQQLFRIEERVLTERPERPERPALPSQAALLDLSPPSSLRDYVPVQNRSGEWRWLDDAEIAIDELRIGEDDYRKGIGAVTFAPDGGADPADVWIRDRDGYGMRARVIAFTGEVRLEEAPREAR